MTNNLDYVLVADTLRAAVRLPVGKAGYLQGLAQAKTLATICAIEDMLARIHQRAGLAPGVAQSAAFAFVRAVVNGERAAIFG